MRPEWSSVRLPLKVPNSWSPFAATVTNEPPMAMVSGPVKVIAPLKWVATD
jgi:hypothetical protein